MAVNCWVSPLAMLGFVGVTAIDTSVAAVTVSVAVLLVTPLEVAVIAEVPVAIPVARPPVLMVATAGVAEFQAAVPVRLAVVPSV